jgi:hypothetical protein
MTTIEHSDRGLRPWMRLAAAGSLGLVMIAAAGRFLERLVDAQDCPNPPNHLGCATQRLPSACVYNTCLTQGSGQCPTPDPYDPPGTMTNWNRSRIIQTFGPNYRCLWGDQFIQGCSEGPAWCGETYAYIDECMTACDHGLFYWACRATAPLHVCLGG